MREFEPAEPERGPTRRVLSVAASEAAAPSLMAERLAAPEAVLGLQQTGGNEATVQLLSVQRDAAPADEDLDAEPGRSPVLDIVGRGGGQPLDAGLRAGMEQAIGADLGDVRVHTDGAAAESARAVQAHAYTVGNDVVFGAGQYQPTRPEGQRMLAHELTHVVQQRSGPVEGTATGDGVAVSDPSDRFEQAAEANADRIMAAGGAGADAAVAQRQADTSAPGVAALQRDEAPAEEEEPDPEVREAEAVEAPDESEEEGMT